MGIVEDLLSKQKQLAYDRAYWESAWRDCVRLTMPAASRLYDYGGVGGAGGASASAATEMTGLANKPEGVERSREIYDSTASWAVERLAAGMESLVTPRGQKWHGFQLDDPFGREPTDIEEEWLDKLRDYHFNVRYDPKSNFGLANQKRFKNNTVLGTAVVYEEGNEGRKNIDPVKVPFFFKSIPIIECYLGMDMFDDVDTNYRVFTISARAAAEYFTSIGGTISAKLSEQAQDPSQSERKVTIMHAVQPRKESGSSRVDNKTNRSSRFAQYWVEVDTKHLIKDGGYYSFPYQVTWWDQTDGSCYGQSPIMMLLADIKTVNAMSKIALTAAMQSIKPATASMPGIYGQRPNLNPGANNPGYMDKQGNLMIKPIITAPTAVTLGERVIQAKQMGIQQGLYIPLFQTLMDNPQMTATEALIRNQEKGDLLGPVGTKFENGIAGGVEREVDIVGRLGAFDEGSPLAPPASLVGKEVGVRWDNPMSRLRRMAELQGMDRVLERTAFMAQYDPSVMARVDPDEVLEITREIGGGPRRMFRTDEEVSQMRQQAAQAQERQAALQATEQMAGAAGAAAPAMKMMNDMRTGRTA